jgi:pimeloyl-ACP methyl ester carboxylesterase
VPATVVLVHGAWHGAWCWGKVVDELRARAIPAVAIDLPGHGASTEPLGDLLDDAAALRSTLDGLDDAVVCGHSYGGAVVSEGAADHPAVRHLVFVSAFLLAPGESCSQSVSIPDGVDLSRLANAIRAGEDGIVTIDPEIAVDAFYHDCPPGDVELALRSLGGQRRESLETRVRRAAWQDRPSTYAVCTEDRALPVLLQRALAARAIDVVDWPTSHSPFFARPDLVASLLAARAGGREPYS